jgi:hypothetical protein
MRRISIPLLVLCTCLAFSALLQAQSKITTFDAPGAGTGPGQGTIPEQNTPAGTIVGYYIDANGIGHGFVPTP